MENEYVMELYNIKTNETIGYVYNSIRLVEDINSVFPIGKDFIIKIEKDGSYNETDAELFCMEIVENVYKKHQPLTMSEETFGHMREDFFKDIPKHYIWYRIVNRTLKIRRLKLEKIYDKSRNKQSTT
jgi:hypothetical protein